MKGVVSYLCLKWHTFFFNIVTYDEQIFSPFRSIVRIFYYNMCSHIFGCAVDIGQVYVKNMFIYLCHRTHEF